MIHISCAHNRWLYAVAIILHSLYITHLISANYYHNVDRTRCLSQNVSFPGKKNITYIIALHLPSSSVLLAQYASKWRHNQRASVSNHRRLDCLLNRLFERRSKKTSKLCVTGLCEGNCRVTGEFTTQRTSNAEKVSIWWRHHGIMAWLIFFLIQLVLAALLQHTFYRQQWRSKLPSFHHCGICFPRNLTSHRPLDWV